MRRRAHRATQGYGDSKVITVTAKRVIFYIHNGVVVNRPVVRQVITYYCATCDRKVMSKDTSKTALTPADLEEKLCMFHRNSTVA